jgi:IclR family KDG regulon transcriptional repressor
MTSDLNVRAVARAVAILEQFTLVQPEATLTEISGGIGLSKSTTHRLLSTLEAAGMVEFDRKTTRYRLGLKLYSMGSVASKSMELVKQADPLLRSITDETDETSLLLVADGREALCLRRFDGNQQVRVLIMEAGKHIPFNCGAAQRVLLAHLPDSQWEEVVAAHTRRATQYSLVARDELDRDRHEIRERGYAVGWEDCALHACSLGVPLRAAGGAVVAAAGILGIVERFSAERLSTLVRRIMQLGNDLSDKLGYRPREGG